MTVRHQIAVVADTERLKPDELAPAVAAIQTQLDRDFSPIWNINASISAIRHGEKVPDDCWPVYVMDSVAPNVAWFHSYESDRPTARVTYGPNWTTGTSHCLLEMLVDPSGTRLITAKSVRPGEDHDVHYLVEICDPCASPRLSYPINGVMVADFCTPEFWAKGRKRKAPFSFTGALKAPLQIAQGGHITWLDPQTSRCWQKIWWDERPSFRDMGHVNITTFRKGSWKERPLIAGAILFESLLNEFEIRTADARRAVIGLIERFGEDHKATASGWRDLRPRNLEEVYDILHELSDIGDYVFRGHASVEWLHLAPSLHRMLRSDNFDLNKAVVTEAAAIRTFRRHSRSLMPASELAYFDRILDGITLMQHYGAPTRLLDWTLSPWVACYFAVEREGSEDAAIWAFNQEELRKANQAKRGSPVSARFRDLIQAVTVEQWAEAAFKCEAYVDVFRYQYANQQMSAQQSMFTISGVLGEEHDVALARSLGEDWQRLRVIIPHNDKRRLKQRLFRMNVSALALFPTIDGVGRNIREAIECGFSLGDEGLLWALEESARANRRTGARRTG